MVYKRDTRDSMQGYITKKAYLKSMVGRLNSDVKPYLKLILRKNNTNKRLTGFWAMVRLITPVVAASGQVFYPELKGTDKQGSQILRDLNVPYPIICWYVFRNSLIHSDEISILINDEKELYSGWSLSFGGGHTTSVSSP